MRANWNLGHKPLRAAVLLFLIAQAFSAEVEAIPVLDDHGRHDIYLETFTRVGIVTSNFQDGENYFDEDGQSAGHSERSATGSICFYDRDGVYTGELMPNYMNGFDAFGSNGRYLGQTISGFRGIPEYFDVTGRHLAYSLFLIKGADAP